MKIKAFLQRFFAGGAGLFLLTTATSAQTIPDNFASAQVLSGSLAQVTNNNQNATTETGEPSSTGYRTLWYSWTAPATGVATVNLNGSDNFSQVLTVWLGSSLPNVTLVYSGSTTLSFPVAAGTVYHICTGSYYSGSYGNIEVNLSLNTSSTVNSLNVIGGATTSNSVFASRVVVNTQSGSYIGYNGSSVKEAVAPNPGYSPLWYVYHAPATGRLSLSLVGSASYTQDITVWHGTQLQNLIQLIPTSTSGTATLPVVQGNDYIVCVDSYYSSSSGPIVLTFALNANSDLNGYNLNGGAVFTNDYFSGAATLTGNAPAAVSYTTYATRQALEPSNNGYNTVWFSWTAPAAGATQVLTQGSDAFTTVISVYTGTGINNLTQVTQTNTGAASFNAVAGQTYYVSVGSYYSSYSGAVVLSIYGQSGGPATGPTLTMRNAVGIRFQTVSGRSYRLQSSQDLVHWNSLTNLISGDGSIQEFFTDIQGTANASYRVSVQ